jgi:hypothetical protein
MSKKIRNPQNTDIALEDLLAIDDDVIRTLVTALIYALQRLKDHREIAQFVRFDPKDYDPERPNRKRESLMAPEKQPHTLYQKDPQ